MFFIFGTVLTFASVFGGFIVLAHGDPGVLWQPFEFVIIFGSAIGGFIIANPKEVLFQSMGALAQVLKGPRYNKASYLELLSLLYVLFKESKSKGMLSLERHVENPGESTIFQAFPAFAKNKTAMTFLTDYLRLLTLGTDNPHELEALIDEEIETHHAEESQVVKAFTNVADALPALGIVAAVLGIIKTMGAITEPPEVLGGLIAGALVGTFLGVLLSYGFVGPIAFSMKTRLDTEVKYFQCIKAGLIAYLQGYAPAVSVEFARKALISNVRPTFYEVEDAVANAPSPI